jgi:hypothetical protein
LKPNQFTLGEPLKRSVMLLLMMIPLGFLFEVMDKEPSLIQNWIVSILWLALVVVAIALMLAWAQISELRDPFVAPSIVREAGYSYLIQSYLTSAIAILFPSVGAIMKWRTGSKYSPEM